jgi:hypothetical protein
MTLNFYLPYIFLNASCRSKCKCRNLRVFGWNVAAAADPGVFFGVLQYPVSCTDSQLRVWSSECNYTAAAVAIFSSCLAHCWYFGLTSQKIKFVVLADDGVCFMCVLIHFGDHHSHGTFGDSVDHFDSHILITHHLV